MKTIFWNFQVLKSYEGVHLNITKQWFRENLLPLLGSSQQISQKLANNTNIFTNLESLSYDNLWGGANFLRSVTSNLVLAARTIPLGVIYEN